MQALMELETLDAVCARFPVKGAKCARFERPLMVQAYLFFHALLTAHMRGSRFDDSAAKAKEEMHRFGVSIGGR